MPRHCFVSIRPVVYKVCSKGSGNCWLAAYAPLLSRGAVMALNWCYDDDEEDHVRNGVWVMAAHRSMPGQVQL
jgi:hypothetical protein